MHNSPGKDTIVAPSVGYTRLPTTEDEKPTAHKVAITIETTQSVAPLTLRLFSAGLYAIASIFIVFVNKILLTNLRFPSFLAVGVGQMVATIVVIRVLALLGVVTVPTCDRSIVRKIFPLPIFYVCNLVSGLGGTQRINLPMMTVLRRFSILMTMALEWWLLGVRASLPVRISVALMVLGSMVAALYDLTYDTIGYALIMFNNVCTAGNGVYTKKKLESKELGKYGLMYYNCLFMLFPATWLMIYSGDWGKVVEFYAAGSMTISVWTTFLLSCICGFVLNYSIVLCTQCNSALTTACVGPIKNLFVTYVGMFSSGDYVFQWTNFLGINISVAGSLLYTYVTFRGRPSKSNKPQKIVPTAARRHRQITVEPRAHKLP